MTDEELHKLANKTVNELFTKDAYVTNDEAVELIFQTLKQAAQAGYQQSYPGGTIGGMPIFNKANTDYVEKMNRKR
jgi:hypothetical protein